MDEPDMASLYHYCDEKGLKGILSSQQLHPSFGAKNPADVRYGDGQYLSDLEPGIKTPAQLSRAFLGQPFRGSRFTHSVEIDVTGSNVIRGRPHVFVIPNDKPLDITGRIIRSGKVERHALFAHAVDPLPSGRTR
jgi:hypothetical protein